MSRTRNIIFSTVLAMTPILTAGAAHADRGQVLRINADGRVVCNALAAKPATYWDAKVRGKFLGYSKSKGKFVLRTCFQSKSECFRFTNRIANHVHGIEYVSYAGCQPR